MSNTEASSSSAATAGGVAEQTMDNDNQEEEEEEEQQQQPLAATAATAATAAATFSSSSGVACLEISVGGDTDADAAMARRWQAHQQLVSVFGFDSGVARRALEVTEEVYGEGSYADWVTGAYNYILDQGMGDDGGGPVIPKEDCPHGKDAVQVTVERLEAEGGGPDNLLLAPCAHIGGNQTAGPSGGLKRDDGDDDDNETPCGSRKENWLCLTCGGIYCSRYVKGHGVAHYQDTGHCMAVSFSDLSVWCHECQAYVILPALRPLLQQLEDWKFSKDDHDKNDKAHGGNATSPKDPPFPTDGDGGEGKEEEDNNGNGHTDGENNDKEAKSNSNDDAAEGKAKDDGDNGNDNDDDDGKQNNDSYNDNSDKDEDGDNNDDGDDDDLDSEEMTAARHSIFAAIMAQNRALAAAAAAHGWRGTPPVMKTVADVAAFIQSSACQSIVVLAGAGMSVASGIPDFRSVGGVYDRLRVVQELSATPAQRQAIREDPTLCFDRTLFLENALPCHEVQKSFVLGVWQQRWKATIAHRLVECLFARTTRRPNAPPDHHNDDDEPPPPPGTSKLTRLYTQNIDGLEGQCRALPAQCVVPVHGAMNTASCELCHEPHDFDQFCRHVRDEIRDIHPPHVIPTSRPVYCLSCGRPTVKPDIVLFRSPLPKRFHECCFADLDTCDLLLVMGTSLTVSPANTLVFRVPPWTPRVVINNERVGKALGIQYQDDDEKGRDVFLGGPCEDVCLELLQELGWIDDLKQVVQEQQLPPSSLQLVQERLATTTTRSQQEPIHTETTTATTTTTTTSSLSSME